MVLYIIMGVLLVFIALDLFYSSDFTLKVFTFGFADSSKYDVRKFRIIHSILCSIALLLILAALKDNYRPIWIILLAIEVVVSFILIPTLAKTV